MNNKNRSKSNFSKNSNETLEKMNDEFFHINNYLKELNLQIDNNCLYQKEKENFNFLKKENIKMLSDVSIMKDDIKDLILKFKNLNDKINEMQKQNEIIKNQNNNLINFIENQNKNNQTENFITNESFNFNNNNNKNNQIEKKNSKNISKIIIKQRTLSAVPNKKQIEKINILINGKNRRKKDIKSENVNRVNSLNNTNSTGITNLSINPNNEIPSAVINLFDDENENEKKENVFKKINKHQFKQKKFGKNF